MKLLYHGIQENPLTCKLSETLISKETSGNSHGNRVFLTDSLDYCIFMEVRLIINIILIKFHLSEIFLQQYVVWFILIKHNFLK